MKKISFSVGFTGVLVGSFAVGCSAPGKVGDGTGAGGTNAGSGGVVISTSILQGGSSGAGGDGGTSGASGTTAPDGTCGDTTISPNQVPTDVLLVLDRSSSMGYSITGDCYCAATSAPGTVCQPAPANCADRWSIVSSAVSSTISATTSLNWGMELFSAPDATTNCSVSVTPQVPIAAAGAAAIQALLPGMRLSLYTPTTTAINLANVYLQGLNDGNDKVILLATDGEPNCKGGQSSSEDDTPAAVAAAAAAARNGFPVYVVGIGPQAALSNLTQIAQAGGTDHFYPADSAASLSTSLAAITKIVAKTCEFHTPQVPPDDTLVYVYVNKALINKDAQPTDDGWMFGNTTSDIVLTGSYCTSLLDGANLTVQIIFGCPGIPPQTYIP